MNSGRINIKLILVLTIAIAVVVGTGFGLRKYFRSRTVVMGFEQGTKAYSEGNWDLAAEKLGDYLAVRGDDIDVLMKYADAQLKRRPRTKGNIEQASSALRAVLRLDENNEKATNQFLDLYIGMGGFYEAQLKAEDYLKNNQSAEIKLKLAVALIGQRKFKQAYQKLNELIEKEPDYVPCYELMAEMALKRPDEFVQLPSYWLDLSVKNNPDSALGYVVRGSYLISKLKTEDGLNDLEKAKSLAEDAELKLRIAREYIAANNLSQAELLLDEIKPEYQNDVQYWQVKSLVAIKRQNIDEMVSTAKKGIDSLGYNYWDFLPIAIEMFIEGQDIETAEKYIDKLSQTEGSQAQVLFYKGMAAYKQNKRSQAITMWTEAIELGYKTPRIRTMLASAYSDMGNMTSAIWQLRNLISDDPDNFEARLNLARLLLQTDDLSGAVEQAQFASQIKPDNQQALNLFVQSKMQLLEKSGISKNSTEWMELEDRLLQTNSQGAESIEVLLRHLQLYVQTGKLDKAEAKLTQMRERFPDSLETALGEIELMAAKGQTQDIESKLLALKQQFPDRIEPIKYLLSFYHKNSKTDEMISVLLGSIKEAKNEKYKIQLATLLADTAINSKQQDSVLEIIGQIVQEYPDSILLKRKLLGFEKVYKDSQTAQNIINQIKDIEGANGWQWRYEQARFDILQGNLKDNSEKIVNMLKEALLAEPGSLDCRLLLGAAYSQLGDNNSAINIYRQAIARYPDNPYVIAGLVTALYRVNEFEQADILLKRAAERNITTDFLSKLQTQSLMRAGDYQKAEDILENILAQNKDDFDSALTLALLSMRQGEFQKAQEIISNLKEKFSDSPSLAFAQVELNVRQGNLDKAIEFCNQIIDKQANAQNYIIRGRTYLMMANTENAEKDFLKAIEVEPENPNGWIFLSSFYNNIGKSDKSVEIIQQAVDKIPDNIQLLRRAIILLGSSQDSQLRNKSGELINKALAIAPEDSEFLMFKARYLISQGIQGNFEEATSILMALTSNYPNYADAWLILGQLNLDFGNDDKALDYAEQGLLYSPDDKPLLLFRARMLILRSPARANEMLEKLFAQYPNDKDVVLSYAEVLSRTGRADKAVEIIEKYLADNSTDENTGLKIMLAVALEKSGNSEQSAQLFDELSESKFNSLAIFKAKTLLYIDQKNWQQLVSYTESFARKDKTNIPVCLSVASTLAESQDINSRKTAEDLLYALSKVDSSNAQVMGMLGIVLQMNGRPSESAEIYKKVIQLQPENVVALNNLAWILCQEQGLYEQALELANKGASISPNYEDIYDTRGVIYYRMGKFEEAVKDFTKAIELIPIGNAVAAAPHFHLGRVYSEMGEKAKAIDNLSKAIELDSQAKILSADDLAQARRLLYQLTKNF